MFLLHLSLFPTAKINIFYWPLRGNTAYRREKCAFEIPSGTHTLLWSTDMLNLNTMPCLERSKCSSVHTIDLFSLYLELSIFTFKKERTI